MAKSKPLPHRVFPETLGMLVSDSELERRERRVRRLLTLEELIRLNRRVDEFGEGRYPPGTRMEMTFDAAALGQVLRLVTADLLRQGTFRPTGTPEELKRQQREAQDRARKLQSLITRIAAILSQTYAELGDGAPLPDDEALRLVRELLLDDDEQIIDRERARGVALVKARQL
jgi:hypothetical protein